MQACKNSPHQACSLHHVMGAECPCAYVNTSCRAYEDSTSSLRWDLGKQQALCRGWSGWGRDPAGDAPCSWSVTSLLTCLQLLMVGSWSTRVEGLRSWPSCTWLCCQCSGAWHDLRPHALSKVGGRHVLRCSQCYASHVHNLRTAEKVMRHLGAVILPGQEQPGCTGCGDAHVGKADMCPPSYVALRMLWHRTRHRLCSCPQGEHLLGPCCRQLEC